MHGLKKLPQDCHPGCSQTAGALKAEQLRKILEITMQGGNGISETGEAGVTAHLTDNAEDADGAELLEDVGIAKDRGLNGRGLVCRLVLPDRGQHGGNFSLGKARLTEDAGCVGAGVGDMVPAGKLFRVFRAVTRENAEIVKPGGGGNNLAVVREIRADGTSQFNQAGLMPEFIHRPGLGFHVSGQSIQGVRGHDTFVIFQGPVQSGRIREMPPRSYGLPLPIL